MPRQLTQGERDELIAYMQGMKADEAFVNQRVKNVQDEGSSPMYGYLDVGENIFTNPAAIYRTIPSIEQNFESLPVNLQQQIIRGGRARDEARFMGASGGSLVTPDQRRFGLLYGDMPYMDTTARQQRSPEEEVSAMEAVRGTERIPPENITQTIPVAGGAVDERLFGTKPTVTTMPAPRQDESTKSVFGSLLDAMIPVGQKVAQKRGFSQDAVNPLQTATQAGGTYQESKPVDAGFLAAQTYPTDNRLRPDLPPRIGAFDPMNPNIQSVESFDPVEAERQRDARAAAQQQSRLVDGSFSGDLGVNEVISGVRRTEAGTPISFDADSGLGFKPDGQIGLQGDPNDLEYQAGEIQKDLEEAIPEAKEKLDFGRLAKALALGFNTLRLNPDQQLASYLGKSLEQDRQLKISRAAADRYRKAGYSQIADALMAGEITGKEAFSAYSALAKAPVFRPATVDEKAKYGLKAGDFAQVDEKSGRLYTSSGMNIDLGDKAGTAIDSEFAKTYMQDLRGLGGSIQQINTLKSVLDSLESGEVQTGVAKGLLPDWALAITDPKSLDARNQVAGIVQQTLRETLGAQFTEREGENLLRRAWDLRQPTETNIRNTRRLLEKAMAFSEEKMKQIQYFQTNGTLKGYKSENLAKLMAELESIKRDLTRDFSKSELGEIKNQEDSFEFGGDTINIKEKESE